jgi:catechol 2,3-dioxygenase-like lactoylglutathione lyase family enzyme
MHEAVSILLTQFEAGAISRREVIAALTSVVVAATASVSAAPLGDGALDHLGLQVSDLDRSPRFYRDVLGLSPASGDRPDGSVRLNLPRGGYVTLRNARPAGTVDHFCLALSGFNKEAVSQQLRARNVIPIDEPNFTGTGAGFHVIDPDGLRVQLA